ncbi:hypothetical protein [Haladaptatus sp. DJG-WS-42]|uniref:hypothetical protein n=1 Tax=Haladaptatus sp. DJG-WS-42 TaxID=3120516 RepID=UPI0030D5064E
MTNSQEFHDTFCDIEIETGLFEIEADGVNIWERIRFPVYREIQNDVLNFGTSHDSIAFDVSDYARGLSLFFRNTIYRNPFFAGKHDIIVWGHPRRKQREDGKWWDIYCDPLYEECNLDVSHFEQSYQNQHLSPARTNNLRYLDLIEYAGTFLRKSGLVDYSLSKGVEKILREAEESFRDRFNVEIDLVSRAEYTLSNRRSTNWLYKRLIERIDPEMAVVVVSYGKENFIEICKNNQIPVVELQHGVIHPQHVGYSYPKEYTKETFPDYLLTFGDFWKDTVDLTIPDNKVISVGYPFLEESIAQYDEIESTEQLLFISQGTIGEHLSRLAVEVDQHPEFDWDIVYKLHPGEYERWEDAYPWLLEANFKIVDSQEPQLYKLFSESSAQIGVGSTAVFEGLAFGLETFVYECSGSEILQPLVDDGSAKLISSADELVLALEEESHSFDRDYYFKPNAAKQACETFERLQHESPSPEK